LDGGALGKSQPDIEQENSMSEVLSPLVSEFATHEQEAGYTAWLKAKIERVQSSSKPLVSHDQVMAEARTLIESKSKQSVAG
jgi:hypothetical protein